MVSHVLSMKPQEKLIKQQLKKTKCNAKCNVKYFVYQTTLKKLLKQSSKMKKQTSLGKTYRIMANV